MIPTTANTASVQRRPAELALEHPSRLGEGPTWDGPSGTLIWVDILGGDVHRFDPESGRNHTVSLGRHVGAAKPCVAGGLAVNLDVGVAVLPDSGRLRWLTHWPRPGYRGNDAGVDAMGRLWAGTMPYDESQGGGALYRVDAEGRSTRVLDVGVANGVAWSPAGTVMYFVDSPTKRIDAFDFDVEAGTIRARRVLAEIPEDGVFPDGIYCDAEGSLWVALYGGYGVRRFDPQGRLIGEVPVPVRNVTACAMGGNGLRDLYITTASSTAADDDPAEPKAGSLFVLPDAGSGVEHHRVAI